MIYVVSLNNFVDSVFSVHQHIADCSLDRIGTLVVDTCDCRVHFDVDIDLCHSQMCCTLRRLFVDDFVPDSWQRCVTTTNSSILAMCSCRRNVVAVVAAVVIAVVVANNCYFDGSMWLNRRIFAALCDDFSAVIGAVDYS